MLVYVRDSEHRLVWCPACNTNHELDKRWAWNGSLIKPTFHPSILVTWKFKVKGIEDKRCHSFVRNGEWQFLNDCTHSLAGKTVPMENVP